jgi:hypothetical protein
LPLSDKSPEKALKTFKFLAIGKAQCEFEEINKAPYLYSILIQKHFSHFLKNHFTAYCQCSLILLLRVTEVAKNKQLSTVSYSALQENAKDGTGSGTDILWPTVTRSLALNAQCL